MREKVRFELVLDTRSGEGGPMPFITVSKMNVR